MKPLVVSSVPAVAEAASAIFPRGNAVDAVVAGVFAAAALSPSVLLGHVQLLIGGPGAGPRAVDGRVRQPGLGVPRPRGFKEGEAIPEVARVGVPALPAALCTALASAGSATLSQVLAPARELSKKTPRARVFERIVARGASAVTDAVVARPLVELAGRVAGGLLTEDDLAGVRPVLAPCAPREIGELRLATCPWSALASDPPGAFEPAEHVHVIAAGDIHGLTAIACWEQRAEGSAVEALGLTAPWTAEPVRRGEPRVRPGEPRPAAAPIALVLRGGFLELALGASAQSDAEKILGEILTRLGAGTPLDSARRGLPVVGLARSRTSLGAVGV
jgi:gamma-glutamyltranspeptidase/glutathione hydrolase